MVCRILLLLWCFGSLYTPCNVSSAQMQNRQEHQVPGLFNGIHVYLFGFWAPTVVPLRPKSAYFFLGVTERPRFMVSGKQTLTTARLGATDVSTSRMQDSGILESTSWFPEFRKHACRGCMLGSIYKVRAQHFLDLKAGCMLKEVCSRADSWVCRVFTALRAGLEGGGESVPQAVLLVSQAEHQARRVQVPLLGDS